LRPDRGRLLYLRTGEGKEYAVHALERFRVDTLGWRGARDYAGKWRTTTATGAGSRHTPVELRNEIDHFHVPSDSVADRDTWAEWHYFNVLSRSKPLGVYLVHRRWDVTSTRWGGSSGITMRQQKRSDAAVRDDF